MADIKATSTVVNKLYSPTIFGTNSMTILMAVYMSDGSLWTQLCTKTGDRIEFCKATHSDTEDDDADLGDDMPPDVNEAMLSLIAGLAERFELSQEMLKRLEDEHSN